MPCFTRNHIWPLGDSTGIFLKAIMKFMARNHMFEFSTFSCRHRKLKLSSSLASSCALILILTSCEGGLTLAAVCWWGEHLLRKLLASSFLSPRVGAQNHRSRRVDVDAPYYRQIMMKSTALDLKSKMTLSYSFFLEKSLMFTDAEFIWPIIQ